MKHISDIILQSWDGPVSRFLDHKQVALYLGLSESTAENLMKDEIRTWTFSKKRVTTVEVLEQWIELSGFTSHLPTLKDNHGSRANIPAGRKSWKR